MPKKTITEKRLYPVILHREGDTWGYFSPEFGGGGAPTQADALLQAQEMLEGKIAELLEAGEPVPSPSEANDKDAAGGQIAWLPVVTSNAAERLNEA